MTAAGTSGAGLADVLLEGTDATVTLLVGPVSTVLAHVARRFHYEVTRLAAGDAHGWQPRGEYASGCAIALLPGRLAPGADGLFPAQVVVVRDVLADCGGLVRWGGDDPSGSQGHFRVAVVPGDPLLAQLAGRLVAHRPGTQVDVLDPQRSAAAQALARRQSRD